MTFSHSVPGDDQDIRASLKEIDEGDFDVTPWEAGFLQSVLYSQNPSRPLTQRQREVAESMIEDYLED